MNECELLKEKIKRIKDTLNYKFKEVDNLGVSTEYNAFLDESTNPDINKPCKVICFLSFIVERVEREKNGVNSYIYYG